MSEFRASAGVRSINVFNIQQREKFKVQSGNNYDFIRR